MIRLKELREKKQVTQAAMAELIGVSLETYCAYESGEKQISFYGIQACVDFFDVPAAYFLGITESEADETNRNVMLLDLFGMCDADEEKPPQAFHADHTGEILH